jgi:catalase
MPEARVDLSVQLVDAINDVQGVHPGHRAAHAKGTLCAGSFTSTPAAAELTTAAHMQGDPVPTTVRFSNGAGNPNSPDGARDGRGMATKFYLPDESRTDIVALTLPMFFVRTPDDFIEFMRARKPNPETGKLDFEKIGAFLGVHPEAQRAIEISLGMEPPSSYLRCRYHSIHAFKFVAPGGGERFVRYRWEPEEGVETIPDEEAKSRERDYLQVELGDRLSDGPAAFKLHAQLADDGDDPDDPTEAWPEERDTVELGRLELTGIETGREQGDDILVFDPTRVTEGIECSNDQILLARPGAYSVSVERRTGVARD